MRADEDARDTPNRRLRYQSRSTGKVRHAVAGGLMREAPSRCTPPQLDHTARLGIAGKACILASCESAGHP
jgi:hypothetical protein